MANAVLRSAYRVDAQVKTVYSGNGVDVPANGQFIASATTDKVVLIEYDTGAILCTAGTGDGETISNVCCSDDGLWVFAASRSLQGYLWRVVTDEFFEVTLKRERSWLISKHPISSCAFSPDSAWLATACTDGAVRLWEPAANSFTHTLHNDGGIILSVAFVVIGKHTFMVATCFSGSVTVWDLDSKEHVLKLADHAGAVECVSFFYDGAMMVTGGRDGKINVYRLSVVEGTTSNKKRKRSSNLTFEATNSHSFTVLEEVSCIARCTKALLGSYYGDVVDDPEVDKEVIVMGGETGVLKYFYLERTGRARKCKKELKNEALQAGKALPRLLKICGVKQQNELMVATADHDLEFFTPTLQRKRLIVGNIDQVVDAKYGMEDQVAAASNSASLRVFHTTNPFCELMIGHTDVVLTLGVSSCRKFLASGSKDRTIRVWDLTTLKCLAILTGHSHDVTGVAFGTHAEGSSAAPVLVSASADLSLKLWTMKDVMSSKRHAKLQQEQGLAPDTPVTIESSPNDTQPRAHETDIYGVCFSPNAEMVASCSKDKTVRVWGVNKTALRLMVALKGHRKRVHCVKFSTHEKVVASGGGDNTVKLWSVNAGEGCLKTFQGHAAPVLDLAFINKGLQIVSCSSDGMVKVWGIKLQTSVASLQRHKERIWCIAVAADDGGVITGGSDGVINVWKDYTDDDVKEATMKRALKVKEKQLLADRMRLEQYGEAIELCLKLDHPRDLREALVKLDREGIAEKHLKTAIQNCEADLIEKLINYTKKWMLNALHADVAALCVRTLLSTLHITHLSENPELYKSLEALLNYGTRHHDRLRLLQQQLHLIPLFCNEPPAIPALPH
eukprot:TRINITY_DN12066_c0_g1_i1.p1 TRINITY_DN12066_c0_g1~~TRINITY_DN12066_c0_g1_i1.p1  ORF type:complete len:854 (+),score=318.89 TRINITY_DN12066_c0_g1_i1:32-2563(+)